MGDVIAGFVALTIVAVAAATIVTVARIAWDKPYRRGVLTHESIFLQRLGVRTRQERRGDELGFGEWASLVFSGVLAAGAVVLGVIAVVAILGR